MIYFIIVENTRFIEGITKENYLGAPDIDR